ncbi:hypothetical protein BBJ28_00010789 [Nothophytophthora sp. Chile5]|nr:hypothetical protein BBJ28_00010789 [Nothophytophthora sp. Chile5]
MPPSPLFLLAYISSWTTGRPHNRRSDAERPTNRMEKYVKVRKIGQGSFGCAYLATRKVEASSPAADNSVKQQFVIKEISLDPRDQANAQREARLLAALDHPNIIACKESFLLKPTASIASRFHPQPTVLCIVTEFADGGDLSQALERRAARRVFFEPDELLGLFVQICLALKHLHDRKILHRDVKPANIFLTKTGVVKLGDLGVATVLSHTLACAQTATGTPYYTAPEICLGKRYNAKADVWSLGCVLFELATLTHAFQGRSQRQLFENIVRGDTPSLPGGLGELSSIRKDLQTLVNDMLRKNPSERPSVNQLIRRPVVLARIQSFLSTHALAMELNHTVLHGHHVLQKRKTQEKPRLQEHLVRQAEPVRRLAAADANAKVLKPRAIAGGVLRRSRSFKKRLPSPPASIRARRMAVGAGRHDKKSAVLADKPKRSRQLARNLRPPVKAEGSNKPPKPSTRAYPKPVVIAIESQQPPPPPAPVGLRQRPGASAVRGSQPLRERRLEFQRRRQIEKPPSSPLDDPIILVQQLPEFKTSSIPPEKSLLPPPAPVASTSQAEAEEEADERELSSLPAMASLEFERMVLQLKSVLEADSSSDEDEEDEPLDLTTPPPYTPLLSLSPTVLGDPAFRLALQQALARSRASATASSPGEADALPDGETELQQVPPAQQAALSWMRDYIHSLL